MYNYSGWIARSAAGHDKGTLLCVVGIDQGGQRLLVADGKRRRVANPKPKKLGHLDMLTDHLHGYDHPTIHKLEQGEPVSDRELRRVLAAFRDEADQGGN